MSEGPTAESRSACTVRLLVRLCLPLLFCLLSACSKTTELQTGLNDADANEIVSALNRHGIEVEKRPTKEGVTLSVDDGNIARATEVMRAAGLPRRGLSSLGQIFKKEGMISTPLEERARYIYGLSAELEYTLQQFEHVVSARVHVVLPERVAPGEPIQPSSAAVFIKYIPPLDEDTVIPRIRSLVSASIPGLSGEDAHGKVSVVLSASELTAPPVEWTSVGPFRVMANSAGSLLGTLVVLILLVVAGAAVAGLILARRDPRAAALIGRYLPWLAAAKPGKAGGPAEAADGAVK